MSRRRYVDLNVRPPAGEAEPMLREAKSLGYSTVAISGPNKACLEGLDIVTRVDLAPRRGSELLDTLHRVRGSYEVVAVDCRTKEAARQAARDHRVDVLTFPTDPTLRREVRLDSQEAELAEEGGCSVEFNISSLLDSSEAALPKLISQIRRDASVAERHEIPIILASGARSAYGLREPKAITALAELFDIDEDRATEMVSKNPTRIIEKNRLRLSPLYIGEGVRRLDDAS